MDEKCKKTPYTHETPKKEKPSLIETFDVKYYGDYAIEDVKKYEYYKGKYA